MHLIQMNFKDIIKQEWEKEFPNTEDDAPRFDESIFHHTFGKIVDRICIKVWNSALDTAANNAEADCTVLDGQDCVVEDVDIECYVLKNSILQFKLQDEEQM